MGNGTVIEHRCRGRDVCISARLISSIFISCTRKCRGRYHYTSDIYIYIFINKPHQVIQSFTQVTQSTPMIYSTKHSHPLIPAQTNPLAALIQLNPLTPPAPQSINQLAQPLSIFNSHPPTSHFRLYNSPHFPHHFIQCISTLPFGVWDCSP
jgi:hypothetical protein